MSYGSGGYGAHQESVEAAKAVVGELQELISVCTDKCEQAMGAIIMAVGQNPNVDSSQNAMNYMGLAKDRFEEIFGITNQVVEELNRYGSGF
jgi:hypothetical protein